ncbi:hypothetical protein [Azonexus hydrophilus]|uniref:Uncharacterized protein n=1 Tax=Azonexus hydrophilus TaxID=418702 RepID=A0ABZ2XN38_9RHOO
MTGLERDAVKQAIRHIAGDEGKGGQWSFEKGMELLKVLASENQGRVARLREMLASVANQ